jgi:hypothetical protein
MNRRMEVGRLILVLAGVGLLAFIISCNTKKQIIKEPIKEKGAEYLFDQLKKNEFKFEWLNIKFSAEVGYNKNTNSFNGNLRIRKDSAIWVSISPALGIEAMRVLITMDSVKLINRLNTTYFVGDFKYISSLLETDLDYDMIQSLLLGNDFSTYENNVFKASIDNKQYLLSTVRRGKLKKYLKNAEDTSKVLIQDIWMNPESYKINKVRVKEIKENRKLETEYSEFEKIDSMLYPTKLHFDIINDKTKIEISIDNSRITTEGPLEFPFNVSSKYKKTSE